MAHGDERFGPLDSLSPARKRLLIVFGLLLLLSNFAGPNAFINPDYLPLEIAIALGLTALVLAIFDRVPPGERSKLRNALIASSVSLLLAAVAAEAAARWMFRNVTASADGGGYFSVHRTPDEDVANAHGFRDRTFSADKPPGVYRIAVVGDSFTYGNGLKPQQRYTNLLDEWLPDQFEVLNFGIPGNNTPQHLDTLRTSVLPMNPDFVLLQWFVNDVEGHDLSGRPRTAPVIPMPGLHRWLNANSALYTIANMRWAEAQIMLGKAPSYPEYLKARVADASGPDARRDAALLQEMVDRSRKSGSDMAIVLFPDPGQDLGEAYPFAFLHERVIGVCQQEGIPCIDLRGDFAAVKDRRALWVSPFDNHPSAKANEIAALKILERLRPRWVK
jgi:hypothetical protein